MKDNITPKKYDLEDVCVVYGLDITTEIMDKCINQIDRVYYPKSTTNSEDIKSWVFEHPQFCFVMLNEESGDVLGYLYCFPLTEKATMGFLQGKRTFGDLKLEDFDDFTEEGIYNLYIASLGLRKEVHNKEVRRLLFECFINQSIQFAKRDMYVNYVFMEIASEFEKEICRLFNIEKLTTNIKNREIYGGPFDLKRFVRLDNYLAVEAVYDTVHAKKILRFKRDYTPLVKAKDKK